MNPKKNTWLIIAVSIAFALAIMLSSYLLADTGQADTAMFILIAIWFVPFSYLSTLASRQKSDKK